MLAMRNVNMKFVLNASRGEHLAEKQASISALRVALAHIQGKSVNEHVDFSDTVFTMQSSCNLMLEAYRTREVLKGHIHHIEGPQPD